MVQWISKARSLADPNISYYEDVNSNAAFETFWRTLIFERIPGGLAEG